MTDDKSVFTDSEYKRIVELIFRIPVQQVIKLPWPAFDDLRADPRILPHLGEVGLGFFEFMRRRIVAVYDDPNAELIEQAKAAAGLMPPFCKVHGPQLGYSPDCPG